MYLFYFWLCWVVAAAHRFSLVAGAGAAPQWCGLLIVVASLVAEHRLKSVWSVGSGVAERGLSSYDSQALEHRLSSCGAQA